MRLTVPGNLLLAGEYLVLDEGGRGLALAVEPRLQASAAISPGGTWSIRAIMGKTSLWWQPGNAEDLPLGHAMLRACAEALELRGRSMPAPLAIELDSSSFFDSQGRKAGFGSSAAAAVALALLTGRAAGLSGADLIGFSADAALAGHRAAQGGRGSGYDIFASLHGGCGVFTGGVKPLWQALGRLPPVHAVLVPGPAAVRSSEAVKAFRQWLALQGTQAAGTNTAGTKTAGTQATGTPTLLELMGASVAALIDSTSAGDATAFSLAMNQAGAAGRLLGRAIGYDAHIEAPRGFESLEVKALGAGNELGLMILQAQGPLPPTCLAFRPTEGPQWLS